jgi:hypothetical protein
LLGPTADDRDFVERLIVTLLAAREMHPDAVRSVFVAEVPRLLRNVPDGNAARILRVGAQLDEIWAYMPSDVLEKLERLVETIDVRKYPHTMLRTFERTELRGKAAARCATLEAEEITALVAADPVAASAYKPLVDKAVERLAASTSWARSNSLIRDALLPIASALDETHLLRIAEACVGNVEVSHAHGTLDLIDGILATSRIPRDRFLEIALATGLMDRFPNVGDDSDDDVSDDADRDRSEHTRVKAVDPAELRAHELKTGVRVKHLRFGLGSVVSTKGVGRETKVEVDFDDELVGRKRLVFVYAGLQRAE